MTPDKIDTAAKALRAARDLLSQRATALHEEIEAATKRKLPGLRNAVADVAKANADLLAAVAAVPNRFVKPKSMVLHGLQFGFRKGNGAINWENDERVIKLIRKHLPDQFDLLVKTTEKPLKTPLSQLNAADLKKIGVTVEDTNDVAFAKDTTAGVDKLVKALLKGVEEEAEEV